MLLTACLATFFSLCHSGEITVKQEYHYDSYIHLSYGDLAMGNPSYPSIISIQDVKDQPGSKKSQWKQEMNYVQ